jgi:hypothetical protein
VRLLIRTLSRSPRAAGATRTSRTSHTTTHSHAKHLRQNIIDIDFRSASPSAGVEGGHAVLVVHGSLVVVAEDLVGLRYRLEGSFGLDSLFLGNLVRVVLQGKLY